MIVRLLFYIGHINTFKRKHRKRAQHPGKTALAIINLRNHGLAAPESARNSARAAKHRPGAHMCVCVCVRERERERERKRECMCACVEFKYDAATIG